MRLARQWFFLLYVVNFLFSSHHFIVFYHKWMCGNKCDKRNSFLKNYGENVNKKKMKTMKMKIDGIYCKMIWKYYLKKKKKTRLLLVFCDIFTIVVNIFCRYYTFSTIFANADPAKNYPMPVIFFFNAKKC